MSMAKVVGGHVFSDNSTPATATTDAIVAYIKQVAEEEFVQANADFATARLPLTPRVEFHVFKKRCWNHLRCTWVENVRKETDGWMANTFKAEVAAIQKEFKYDRFTLEIANLIRLCEKYFCPKGHDAKSDQLDFWAWMR